VSGRNLKLFRKSVEGASRLWLINSKVQFHAKKWPLTGEPANIRGKARQKKTG